MTPIEQNSGTSEEKPGEPQNREVEKNGVQPQQGSLRTPAIVAIVGMAVLALVIYFGIHSRAAAESQLKQSTEQASIPFVNVVFPQEGAPTQEIVLPGSTQAFVEAPIYARTNGYLKQWYFDIGAHVRKGQLLAEIETPEVDQQLQQARADLDTAQANLNIAKITADRFQGLIASGSVSQQETDQAASTLSAAKATVESNAANVRRLEELQSFEKIYAPFDGVITVRNTDIGALIDAGASAQPKELFHIAAINKLRLFVAVPEVYSRAARPGAIASVTLDEFPDDIFHGTLVRSSNSIDPTSRTLLVEVDVDNPTGQLLPGAYVFVHLQLPQQVRSVTIPSNALIFRKEGLQVGVVQDGKAHLVAVKINRDYGNTVEVVSGLNPRDAIIVDPSDSLIDGAPVRTSSGPTDASGR